MAEVQRPKNYWQVETVLVLLLGIILIATSTESTSSRVRYDGYKVLRLTPNTKQQMDFLETMKEADGVHFWKPPSRLGNFVDIMVSPEANKPFLQATEKSGIDSTIFISNVQNLIDNLTLSGNEKSMLLTWTQYPTYDTVMNFLDEQAEKYPDDVTVVNIGKSYEGRDLKVIKISKNGFQRPSIWLDSLTHAREWISGTVATFFINELLNGDNLEVKSWLNHFNFYILPIVNPDGYIYSHNVDRLWRKTRSVSNSTKCRGADPNRNYDFKWQSVGSSKNPCMEIYAGAYAFSEPEVQALANYVGSISSDLVGFFTLHSYSQAILFPYGIKGLKLPEYSEYMRIAGEMQTAFAQKYGTRFRAGSITDIMYSVAGGSIDWVKGTYNTSLTIAIELRDTGRYGFILPANQIIPSALEFLDGFQVVIKELQRGVPRRLSGNKFILKSSPQSPVLADSAAGHTFGTIPSRNSPIISGFKRY